MQIAAVRHAIKTNCGDCVPTVGNTCCHILAMVADPANQIGISVSGGMRL
jgi:hypothetical protein